MRVIAILMIIGDLRMDKGPLEEEGIKIGVEGHGIEGITTIEVTLEEGRPPNDGGPPDDDGSPEDGGTLMMENPLMMEDPLVMEDPRNGQNPRHPGR